MTPESFYSISDWMSYRTSYNEKIDENSWVMRDLWQTTEYRYGANYGVAKYPKQLKHTGIKSLLERGSKGAGNFQTSSNGCKEKGMENCPWIKKICEHDND